MTGIRTAGMVTATDLAIEIRTHLEAIAAIGHTGEPASMLQLAEVMPAVTVICKSNQLYDASSSCRLPAANCLFQVGKHNVTACIIFQEQMSSAGMADVTMDTIAAADKATGCAAEAQLQAEAAGTGQSLQTHQLLMLVLPSCTNSKLLMTNHLTGQRYRVLL